MLNNDVTFFERMQSILLDPVDLRRNMLVMIKTFYLDPAHYGPLADELSTIYYKPKDKHSPLSIQLGAVEGDEHSFLNNSNIPAITINCGPWMFQQQNVGSRDDRPQGKDNESYRKTVDTELRVSHFTRSPDTSLLLGTLTVGFLLGISDDIKLSWALNKFEVGSLTEPKLVSNNNEQEKVYQVDVSTKMNFNFQWEPFIDTKLIKTISFSASKEL